MATAGAGLEVEGVEKFDSLSQQIEDSFIQYHSLLDTHKVKLLERVKKMKELYLTHRDIEKAMKQMEMIKQATNDVVTENLVAGNKEQVMGIWDDKIRDLKRDKDKLDSVCELKFVSNTEELIGCVKKIRLAVDEKNPIHIHIHIHVIFAWISMDIHGYSKARISMDIDEHFKDLEHLVYNGHSRLVVTIMYR